MIIRLTVELDTGPPGTEDDVLNAFKEDLGGLEIQVPTGDDDPSWYKVTDIAVSQY